MNIVEQKRRNNISEYIIHMYQTEDLIRAYEFDIERIEANIIFHLPVDQPEKDELKAWYSKLITQMKNEGLEQSGHLAEVQEIVGELSNIYQELQSTDSNFEEVHSKSKLHIKKSLELAQGQITDEIQICLNGVYGLLLLRMNGKEVTPELMESINAFGDILSYLSYKYKQKYFMSEN